MRKAILILSLSSISGYYSFGQKYFNNSGYEYRGLQEVVNQKLHSNEKDSALVFALWELASHNTFSRPDSGIYYATRALAMAREIEYYQGELEALHTLALCYRSLGNISKNLQVNLEGVRFAEKYQSEYFKGIFLMNVGIAQVIQKDYVNGMITLRRSYPLLAPSENPPISTLVEVWIGRVHLEQERIDSALFYTKRAYAKISKGNTQFGYPWAERQLGIINQTQSNMDSAIYYYKQALAHSRYRSNMNIGANIALLLSKLFHQMDDPDSTIFYANESLNIALNGRMYNEIIETYSFLSDLNLQTDHSKSLDYLKKATIYRDTLDQIRQNTTFNDILSFDEQQRQYELIQAENEFRSRLRTYTFLGSTFTLLVIVFFIYRSNRQKQKAKKKIETAYERLKNTQSQLIQSEKMASLGELTAGIAHEIQNPLNFVNNFSEVNKELAEELEQEADKGNTSEVKALAKDIKENQEKILHHGKRADAIVKGMLAHSRRSSGVKEPTDINALCDEYLRLSYHGLRAKDKDFNANYKTDFDPNLPKVNVIPQDIGRVLLNIINNAFQACTERTSAGSDHTSPADSPGIPYDPTVSISTKKQGDRVEIRVKDNGPGIPDHIKEKIFQPFFTTKPTGQGTGLGLSLSYDIVKAHGGELKVETKEDEGSTFIIQLPTYQT